MSLDVTTLALAKSYADQHSGGGGQVQPDWNQNDDTKPDYVKNRPFYTGNPAETVLVEESSVSFALSGGFYWAAFTTSFNAEFGQTYKIYWDGTVYECVCENYKNFPIIGNRSIMGLGSDTGEPFIILNQTGLNETGWESITTDTSASHTISISGVVAQVTKIDEKYLPELPYMDKLNPTGTGSFSLNRKADTAVATYSFAEGDNTTASGDCSHAEGHHTTASGYSSHAEGKFTTASGDCSHAEGDNTTASGDHSHVEGKYNIEDTANKYAHIIGNGGALNRHNCFMVGWDGAIYVQASDDATKMMKLTIKSDGTISAEQVTV